MNMISDKEQNTITNAEQGKVIEINDYIKNYAAKHFIDIYHNEPFKDWDNSYIVQRESGDFLVWSYSKRHKVSPSKGSLGINNGYFIREITPDGHIGFSVDFHFDMCTTTEFDPQHNRVIYGKSNISRTYYISQYRNEIDDTTGLFEKFIKVDPHWFECATHKASRKQVLSGNAGESIFEKAEPCIIGYYLDAKRKQENQRFRDEYAKEIHNRIKSF